MGRLGLVIVVACSCLVAGCSTSRKVVVQDGYRGATPVPPRREPEPPGGVVLAPEARPDAPNPAPTAIAP